MTLDEFEHLLQSTGFPVSYGEPEDDPGKDGVYLRYQVVQSNNFFADGQVYYPFVKVQVRLYTPDKDTLAEEKLEAALSALCWKKTEEYIAANQNYQITYELEVSK